MSVGPAVWENVVEYDEEETPQQSRVDRIAVPGGWLYLVHPAVVRGSEPLLCFVPDPRPATWL